MQRKILSVGTTVYNLKYDYIYVLSFLHAVVLYLEGVWWSVLYREGHKSMRNSFPYENAVIPQRAVLLRIIK